MKVIKFGGTCLGSEDTLQRAAKVVKDEKEQKIVVVSACAGVTNALKDFLSKQRHEKEIDDFLLQMKLRHVDMLPKKDGQARKEALDRIEAKITKLERLLYGVTYTEELTPRTNDLILSFGERLASIVVAAKLSHEDIEAIPVESDTIGMITNDQHGNAALLWYAAHAFDALPADPGPLADRLGIAPQHRRLFARLVEVMRDVPVDSPDATPDGERACAEALLERVCATEPTNRLVVDLMRQSGDRLAALLRGEIDSREVLFSPATIDMWARFFTDLLVLRLLQHARRRGPGEGRVARGGRHAVARPRDRRGVRWHDALRPAPPRGTRVDVLLHRSLDVLPRESARALPRSAHGARRRA